MNRITSTAEKIFTAALVIFAVNCAIGITILAFMQIGLIEFGPPPKFLWIGVILALWLAIAGFLAWLWSQTRPDT